MPQLTRVGPLEPQPEPSTADRTSSPAITVASSASHGQAEWNRVFRLTSVTSEDFRNIERLTEAKRLGQLLLQVKLLLVVSLPVIAMISISGRVLYEYVGQRSLTKYAQVTSVDTEAIDDLLSRIRVERAQSVEFLMAAGSAVSRSDMGESRAQTDRALSALSSWSRPVEVGNLSFSVESLFVVYFNQQRKLVDSFAVDFRQILIRYQLIVTGFIGTIQPEHELPHHDDLWPLLVSFDSMLRALDMVDTQKSLGDVFIRRCQADLDDRSWFWNLDGKAAALLQEAFNYYSSTRQSDGQDFILGGLRDALEVDRPDLFSGKFADACGNNSVNGTSYRNASSWSDIMTKHLEVLRRIEILIEKQIVYVIGEVDASIDSQLIAVSVVLVTVTCVCLILNFWYTARMHKMVVKVGKFTTKIQMKSLELSGEKRRTDLLLYEMMPREVADQLKAGEEVTARAFEQVSIYFSDIFGFQDISARSSPMEIIFMLNSIYSIFDASIDRYHVYKVETIGDSYMVASGLPVVFPEHAVELAKLAIELRDSVEEFIIPHLHEALHLRIGIHSGPVVAGVVGVKLPRYCLFGDTVNTASRMQTSSESRKIHISQSMKSALDSSRQFVIEERGIINIKGKGEMVTYWLVSMSPELAEAQEMKRKSISFAFSSSISIQRKLP